MPLIFQYGSNCLERRLNGAERLNGDAIDDGRAQTADECEIAFEVWNRQNGCAAADLLGTKNSGHYAWGVLYRTTDGGLERLRQIEGQKYEEKTIGIRSLAEEIKEAKTFIVKTGDRQQGLWTSATYVGYIVKGLRDHQVPEEYIQRVIDVAIRTNGRAQDQNSAKTQLPSLESLRAP